MIEVSVIVPVYNEEFNLVKTLPLLHDFNQVIIVDSQSTDNTVQVAKEHNCDVYQFIWNGDYPKKKNWSLSNVQIKNSWVLFLDADEHITPKFKIALKKAITNKHYVGYKLNYTNFFLGKKLRFGEPMKKLALFRRECGAYAQPENNFKGDNYSGIEIHEHPVLNGKIGDIRAKILHQETKGLVHYISKHLEYAQWEAHNFQEGIVTSNFDIRSMIKYAALKFWVTGWAYFIYIYWIRLGFLDGTAGYIFAKAKRTYFFQIKSLIYEKNIS